METNNTENEVTETQRPDGPSGPGDMGPTGLGWRIINRKWENTGPNQTGDNVPRIKEQMLDVGYIKDGNVWISPDSGEVLSFEQARAEFLNESCRCPRLCDCAE